MKVVKRNGMIVDFDRSKIEKAILGAMEDLGEEHINDNIAKRIAKEVEKEFKDRELKETVIGSFLTYKIPISAIEDRVEEKLMASHCKDVARQYIVYRASKAKIRMEKEALDLLNDENDELRTENSNKNTLLIPTQRDYLAGIICKDISKNYLDKDILKAHEEGIIHFHDMDFSPALPMSNCCLINLDDMLQNGTKLSDMDITKPKSFMTASAIAAQVVLAVSSSQYGGTTISISHLAPFVRVSKEKYERNYRQLGFSGENLEKLADFSLKKEVKDGLQTLIYNILTFANSNGQSPFISIFLWINEKPGYEKETAMLIEELIKQREDGFLDKNGRSVTISFPKLLYVLDDNNTYEGSEYYYLTKLAAQCTAKRMVPDYISAKKMREFKEGNVFGPMGCRSFLQPYYDENNQPKFYGRFNQGVVTINLPFIALESKGNSDEFWKLMDKTTELCYKALMIRHERLKGIKSDVAPILWQQGALARLKPGETIDKLLYNDYSSISLGYAGLYECSKYMTGQSHTENEGKDFAIEVMKFMNNKCEEWKKKTNIGFSIYGTPLESTTDKFAKALKNHFGEIKGVSDHEYITNSYHVNVRENIDAFSKLKFESDFQVLSKGGMISYIEVPSMFSNIDALLSVMKYIYENTMYAEINTKSDYCEECGYEGEIESVQDENGHYIWKCPHCGNTNLLTLKVFRRTCGYIGSNYWNQGRTAEIHDRVLHL